MSKTMGPDDSAPASVDDKHHQKPSFGLVLRVKSLLMGRGWGRSMPQPNSDDIDKISETDNILMEKRAPSPTGPAAIGALLCTTNCSC
jgi:hypothetical protein